MDEEDQTELEWEAEEAAVQDWIEDHYDQLYDQ